jgi:ATP-dependent exoDNAse (exonuclease V) beta subunit
MDRIVVDKEATTVIDFKTGNEDPEYAEQVQGYVKILSDFYMGCTVRGVLAYVDRGILREVTNPQ